MRFEFWFRFLYDKETQILHVFNRVKPKITQLNAKSYFITIMHYQINPYTNTILSTGVIMYLLHEGFGQRSRDYLDEQYLEINTSEYPKSPNPLIHNMPGCSKICRKNRVLIFLVENLESLVS